MTLFTTGFHPSFDALSAQVDLSDVDAARTRVGRHVARCAACRDAVAELRALGDAARAVELPAAPSMLWARIERASRAAATSSPEPRPFPAPEIARIREASPALRPTRESPSPLPRRLMRIGVALLVAAALLAAVLLSTPRTDPLFAGAPSRISFSPARPAPGARVHVRYVPSPRMGSDDRVVLAGQYLTSSTDVRSDFVFGAVYDSLATLRRAPDGAMVGDFVTPPDFRAVSLFVQNMAGTRYEGAMPFSWILVGGDTLGRPVLASLLASLAFDGLYGSPERERSLDTLRRYFPDHPAGFASARPHRSRGLFDLVRFFETDERKYASLDARLASQPALDADRIAAMIDFAVRIEEPAEAAKWTSRLIREHPDDPRAVTAWAAVIHHLENSGVGADSIRRLLPTLDTLGSRTSTVSRPWMDGQDIVQRYGDSLMQRRWVLRAVRARGGQFGAGGMAARWLGDPEIRAAATVRLRELADDSCVPRAGKFARRMSPFDWETQCARRKVVSLSELSRIALIEHRVAVARAYADSALAVPNPGSCWASPGYRVLGEALMAAGDTAAAAKEFAQSTWSGSWQGQLAIDTLRRRVRPVVDSARFTAMATLAEAARLACFREQTRRRKAESDQ